MTPERFAFKALNVFDHINRTELTMQNTVTFTREINGSSIEKIRNQYAASNLKKPSYTSFIIKAIAKAAKEHTYVNRKVFSGFLHKYIYKFKNMDIAVACEKEIEKSKAFAFADVIRDIDKKELKEINQELITLANCTEENNQQLKTFIKIIKNAPIQIAKFLCTLPTRSPKLWMKYRGTAFMISSPAKYGVDGVVATWTHPLNFSFGLVQKKPMVIDNEVQSVLSFTLVMNFDRRVIAGAPAARFFNSIVENLIKQEISLQQEKDNSIKMLAV